MNRYKTRSLLYWFTHFCNISVVCKVPPSGWSQEWPQHVCGILRLQHTIFLYISLNLLVSLPYLIDQCTVTDYLKWATTASMYFLIQYSLAPLAFDAMQSDSGKKWIFGRWQYRSLWGVKVHMNTYLIPNSCRDSAVSIYKYKSIVNGNTERAITYC
jgi:hypothetical protein